MLRTSFLVTQRPVACTTEPTMSEGGAVHIYINGERERPLQAIQGTTVIPHKPPLQRKS